MLATRVIRVNLSAKLAVLRTQTDTQPSLTSPCAGYPLRRVINLVVEQAHPLCRECLDHLLVLGERQLIRFLKEYVSYFNPARPH